MVVVGDAAAAALALDAKLVVLERTLSTEISTVDRFFNSELFCVLCPIDGVSDVADADWLVVSVVVVSVALTLVPAFVLIGIGRGKEGIGECPALFLV